MPAYWRCLSALFTGQPLTAAYFYTKKIAALVQADAYDLVIVDCSSMASYVLNERIPKILDFVDVDSQKWKLYSAMTSFPINFLYKLEAKRLLQFEDRICRNFDFCLVVSDCERQLLTGRENIFITPNGTDLQFSTLEKNQPEQTIIFSGAMNYFPNIDAVIYFYQSILPLIRKEIPTIKFIIAGMQPSSKIRKLENNYTIVTGFIPDMKEYLSKASVCVVPLRIARGIQNKILEAMAIGVPVVATSNANEGIHAVDKEEIMIADNPRDFANATVSLLKNEELRSLIAKKARLYVEKNFCWEMNLRKLDEMISLIAERRDISTSCSIKVSE
jgi:sugar transferase (PEP-CTERM/EpsH1 system associated)